jgi:hypothetical protein
VNKQLQQLPDIASKEDVEAQVAKEKISKENRKLLTKSLQRHFLFSTLDKDDQETVRMIRRR